jgi:hypothetical protein
MHKHSIVLGIALVLIAPMSVHAQVPTVSVYFDAALQNQSTVCPGPGLDTWYVVAENFPNPVEAMEYQIAYPAAVTFLQDNVAAGGIGFGVSPSGIAIIWPVPQGFSAKGSDRDGSLELHRLFYRRHTRRGPPGALQWSRARG